MSNIILCGFKSCGKTTLGQKISQKINRPFIDTDQMIADNCRHFYVEAGLGAFREKERRVIDDLQHVQKSVIATGGGAVLNRVNVENLKKIGKIFYLHVEKEELKRRIFSGPLPAFFDPLNPSRSFEEMYQIRLGIYTNIADYTIEAEDQLWAAIHSDPYFELPRGENLTV